MDRAAKLAAEAREFLSDEEGFDVLTAEENRAITRCALADIAKSLGFSTELEISAAVDQALTDAGTTP